jgi:FtsP/CotA-like multicopper oxidase with cupredoxin domain
LLTRVLIALLAVSWGSATRAQAPAAASQTKVKDAAGRTHTLEKRVTPAERKAAAERLKAKVKKAKEKAKAAPEARAAPAGEGAGGPLALALLHRLVLAAPPAGGYLVGPNKQLIPDYSGLTANWAYSPILTKFVDPLPGLYISGVSPACPTGKYIPVAQARPSPVISPLTNLPEGTNVDYYEIELAEYDSWPFHSEMPATKLRGYRQTNAADPCVNVYSYLGPVILATKGKSVRIKFTNNLPTGAGGNLYIPVDTTVMGSGPGPNVDDATREAIPADVLCMPDQVTGIIPAACYTQNRATIHLHGGMTPWISDGTTHQWSTPAGETTPYPNGVSVYNVPDMVNPGKPGVDHPAGSGVQTFYYTNDQSARLMFYHDHAAGITRLNVYVGEAAGYILRDFAEIGLETDGLIPGLLENIPLVIQEKGFVDATTIEATDPTWNWGTGPVGSFTDRLGNTMVKRAPRTGDLWWPHVYMPAQNPADLSGYNAMGRWNYGPWFYPPTQIPYTPVSNPYYDPVNEPWQPFENPGTPNPSWGAEAFLDTLVINGTAYPTLTVEPKAYRFRILNAGGDRFVNLQWFVAADNRTPTTAGTTGAVLCNGTTGGTTDADIPHCTEVKMVPAAPNTGLPANWPQDGREGGVPDPATTGPDFIAIGSEGGFLPMPVVVPPQPVIWNNDPLTFNFGNVSDFSLLLGPAERADAIVDFGAYAGKTLILYSDAPAAFPALDPRNDYYTGNPDQTDTGGTVPTLPGKGPNTRTLMQVHVNVATGPVVAYDLAALQAAFTTVPNADPALATVGVFQASQDEIIVGQSAYNAAYGKTFPATYPWWGLGRIFDSNLQFETVGGERVTLPAEEKAIHDEMGATFDDYGRMKASLGLSRPNPTPNTANFIMQGYADPPTELVRLVSVPLGSPLADGTQIWRITHNGVDTHPIHFHLFSVQLVNRVGWDGAYRLPHPTELGWKDTVRMSPLEDTYVALRPIAPRPETLPFQVPNSFRPLEPALPIGSTMGFSNRDPLGNPIVPGITNQVANFGWEYVWHCHILSHEENDMMRPVVFAVPPAAPTGLVASLSGGSVVLNWTDLFVRTNGFKVERATDAAFTTGLVTTPVGPVTTFADSAVVAGQTYWYRVLASNTVGSAVPGYPTLTADSRPSNTTSITFVPASTLTLSPTSLSYGDQLVGTNSIVRTVALTNIGITPVTITSVTFTGSFARSGGSCGGGLLPGRTCTIGIRFRPTASGPAVGQVSIASSDPGSPHTAALDGNGLAPVASVAPAALAFSTPLNVPSGQQTVTVTNTGTAPLIINNVTRTGANPGQFAHLSGCPASLAVSASCTIDVTFRPTSANPLTKTATLNVVVAAPATNATVSLTGTIVVPTFTVVPSALAFGGQPRRTTSAPQTVTVTNTSAATLRITGVTRAGPNRRDFDYTTTCGATLAANQVCTISVTFRPAALGLRTASLNVVVAAPGTSQTVPLSGTGL